MRTYNDVSSEQARQQLTFQYGTVGIRYGAVASWRQMFKTLFFFSKSKDLASAFYKSGHHAQIHYGLWQKKTKNFDESIREMTDFAFTNTFPDYSGANIRMVHLGCGFGGTELQLAKNFPNFSSLGVSLDNSQVDIASKLSALNKLSERVKFVAANFLSYQPIASQAFDGGIAIESLCHVPATQLKALWKNVYGILKPRARFTVLDWYLTRQLTEEEKAKLEIFLKGWDMPDCVNVKVMVEAVTGNGFKLVSDQDITEQIMKSAKKIRYRATIFKPIVHWAQGQNNYLTTLGLTQEQTKDFVETSLIQDELFRDRVITYRCLVFQKTQ
jgi:SAM-dependent methyltransferase